MELNTNTPAQHTSPTNGVARVDNAAAASGFTINSHGSRCIAPDPSCDCLDCVWDRELDATEAEHEAEDMADWERDMWAAFDAMLKGAA